MSFWPLLWFGITTMWCLFAPQVFNLNAPVPPSNDTESLNQANQYQNSYNQAFSSPPQHTVEQTEMQPEQIQSGRCISSISLIILFNVSDILISCFTFVWLWLENDLSWCFVSCSWCLPFPGPIRRSSAAFPAEPRLQPTTSVFL